MTGGTLPPLARAIRKCRIARLTWPRRRSRASSVGNSLLVSFASTASGENLRSRGDLGGVALPYAMLNSNKQPVTLNLKSEKGRELLKEMVQRADILVEDFAPV
jgi:hypothetical protein